MCHLSLCVAVLSLIPIAVAQDPNPAGRKGDSRRAYRSQVDQQLQPYRLFIPEQYDPAKPAPLVVALHSIGRDEGAMFDLYSGNLKRECARHGFLAVSPKGRSIASQFRGDAEKDVLDVLAEVRRGYNIDPNRIYILGHSMGASGAWNIVLNNPGLFAGLGLFAGFAAPEELPGLNRIPLFIVHGEDDKLIPVQSARAIAAAAHSLGFAVEYLEVPGGTHEDVLTAQFAPMLNFLAKQHR